MSSYNTGSEHPSSYHIKITHSIRVIFAPILFRVISRRKKKEERRGGEGERGRNFLKRAQCSDNHPVPVPPVINATKFL